MTPHKSADPRGLQVSVKTLLTIAATALGAWLVVVVVSRTLLALTLVLSALMVAIALNHGVAFLERHGLRRRWALAAVIVGALLLIAGLGFLVIPPAISQGKALGSRLPDILKS